VLSRANRRVESNHELTLIALAVAEIPETPAWLIAQPFVW